MAVSGFAGAVFLTDFIVVFLVTTLAHATLAGIHNHKLSIEVQLGFGTLRYHSTNRFSLRGQI